MLIVGLTGGIGSGKSTVAYFFKKKNIPVYNSDIYAKIIMHKNLYVKINILKLFGEKSFINNKLNTNYLSNVIFNNSLKLNILNTLVHPWVLIDFKKWMLYYKSFYCIKETAILFETDSYKLCDIIITVNAPTQVRIQRIMKRDKIKKYYDILNIINHQWPDSTKIMRSDIVIENISNIKNLEKIVEQIHNIILYNKFNNYKNFFI